MWKYAVFFLLRSFTFSLRVIILAASCELWVDAMEADVDDAGVDVAV